MRTALTLRRPTIPNFDSHVEVGMHKFHWSLDSRQRLTHESLGTIDLALSDNPVGLEIRNAEARSTEVVSAPNRCSKRRGFLPSMTILCSVAASRVLELTGKAIPCLSWALAERAFAMG